jgi:Tfp pilus assembly protein PilN
VAILSIQPDMQTGLLRIEGEAKDYAAALTLVANLRETKTFSDVFLLHHEIKHNDLQHTVGFTLSMRWIKLS